MSSLRCRQAVFVCLLAAFARCEEAAAGQEAEKTEEEPAKEEPAKKKDAGHRYDPETSRCIILNNTNFDETLIERGPLFIKFYDPKCNHCKELMPDWEKVADAVNPKDGEAPVYPLRIGCMDCVTNAAKCRQFPKITGYPKLRAFGLNYSQDPQNPQVTIMEYKGKREFGAMVKFAKETGDLDAAKAAQEEAENTEKQQRVEQWKTTEPYFENKAIKQNNKDGLKMLTWGNFHGDDGFFNATQAEDAPPHSQLLVVAHGSGAEDTKWYDAWEDLAKLAHKNDDVNIVVARVDCRNEMPRLCFNHDLFAFPERYDIFPISLLFDKNNPEGKTDQSIHRAKSWQEVAKLLDNDAAVELLEKAAAEEQEMMDEL